MAALICDIKCWYTGDVFMTQYLKCLFQAPEVYKEAQMLSNESL